jgi:hypothetical protein
MIIKLLVLVGLAIYFFTAAEPGLALMSLASIIPNIGLLLAFILTIALIVKTWYGSAAILAALIIWNLVGNALFSKKDGPPPEVWERYKQHDPHFPTSVTQAIEDKFGREKRLFFKRRVTVSEYCETRLNWLFSSEQTKILTSLKTQSDDPALCCADKEIFLKNLRAAHLQLLSMAITKTYMTINLFAEVATFIATYLERVGLTELTSLQKEYNGAFGSSAVDGVLSMVQLLSRTVAAGHFSEDTVAELQKLMYGSLAWIMDDFRKVKIVSS